MELKDAMDFGARFENMEPQPGHVYLDNVQVQSEFLDWVDIRNAGIVAIRVVPIKVDHDVYGDFYWTIEFLQAGDSNQIENAPEIETLWPEGNPPA